MLLLSALAIHLWPFISFTADRSRPFKADTAVTFDIRPFFTYLQLATVLRVTDLSNSPFLPMPIWTCELLKLSGCEGKEVTFHSALDPGFNNTHGHLMKKRPKF